MPTLETDLSTLNAPQVTEWLRRNGVTKYVQYHTPSDLRKQSETAFQAPNTASISEFDGHVELTVSSIKPLQNAFNDPYWREHVKPDEDKFFDPATTVRTMGWEEVKIEGGKIFD